MVSLATTQLSSKGQVVIPAEIRARLGLRPGSRFVVVAGRGAVIFKSIDAPDLGEFDALVARARRQARKAGLRQRDVTSAVRRARGRG
jgi:AbrB family looped-hinge helix DNA binding protein